MLPDCVCKRGPGGKRPVQAVFNAWEYRFFNLLSCILPRERARFQALYEFAGGSRGGAYLEKGPGVLSPDLSKGD